MKFSFLSLIKLVFFICFGFWVRLWVRYITARQQRDPNAVKAPIDTSYASLSCQPLLLTSSATHLASLIRHREVSSETIVSSHIARICQTHPRLNAMVKDRFALALAEAREADLRIAEWHQQGCPQHLAPPPFLGVPCTIKECFALDGMPQSSGLVHRAHYITRVPPAFDPADDNSPVCLSATTTEEKKILQASPRATSTVKPLDVERVAGASSSNATAVSRLLALGVIPLGVSNLSELCMWYESQNTVYGRTSNAYSRHHTAGGSSGGEGALVGSGCTPFGLGSDIGGSIRMPAAFNGVFGHKPTGGLVPSTGQYPIAHGTCMRMLSTGPLCRHSEDLWPLLRALAGPDGLDSSVKPQLPLEDPSSVAVGDLTVYLPDPPRGLLFSDCSEEMLQARARVAAFLRSQGARVEPLPLPELARGFEFWSSRMSTNPEQVPFDVLMGSANGDLRRLRCGKEFLRWLASRSAHTLPAIGLGVVERVSQMLPQKMHQNRVDECKALQRRLNALLAGNAVILFPGFPTTAPRHNEPILRIFDVLYTAVWNALELPVTVAPVGLSSEGLPLSVQIIGAIGQDHLTIAVAQALEKGTVAQWIPNIVQ